MAYLACFLGDWHPNLVRAPCQKPIPYRSLWLLIHLDLRQGGEEDYYAVVSVKGFIKTKKFTALIQSNHSLSV